MTENQRNPQHDSPGNADEVLNGESKSSQTIYNEESLIPEELLNELPPEDRKQLLHSITRIQSVFPQENPLLKKITSDHITTILSHANETDKRDREEHKSERNHNYKILVTILLTVLGLCGIFLWANEIEILKYLIGVILAFGGGFGVGTQFKSRD